VNSFVCIILHKRARCEMRMCIVYADCEDVTDTPVWCILLDDTESIVEVIDMGRGSGWTGGACPLQYLWGPSMLLAPPGKC